MTITFLGWIILPSSLVMIALKPEWVYALAIFFLPFSATSVINVGSGDTASGIQVWFYLATLLLLRWVILILFRLEFRIDRDIRRPVLYLLSFVAACAISLLMPLWISGRLQIMSPLLLDFTTTPLFFSTRNVTAFLYILAGFAFTVFIAHKNVTPKQFRRSASIYLLSCAFVASWGLLQLFLSVAHLPYPAIIFNNSASPSAAGYKETLGTTEIARLTSVAVEPSMLVQTLLVGIAFTLPAFFGSGYVRGRYRDRITASLLIFVCLAATSSVGYIGIALMFLLVCWALYKAHRLRPGFLILSIFGIAALVAAYFTIGIFHDVVDNALLNKNSSFSALERVKTIYYAVQYFFEYPILGVGWGSVTSHDLVAKILSNTGIVGFTAFCAFVGVLFANMRGKSRVTSDKMYFDQASVILFIACVEMFVLATIGQFPDVFGHFWFILGMAAASSIRQINQKPVFARSAA